MGFAEQSVGGAEQAVAAGRERRALALRYFLGGQHGGRAQDRRVGGDRGGQNVAPA